jgi:hypothetical protein
MFVVFGRITCRGVVLSFVLRGKPLNLPGKTRHTEHVECLLVQLSSDSWKPQQDDSPHRQSR